MFSSKALSLERQARLAISLSWIGGFTNVITLIYCAALTSHMTGNATNLALSMVHGDRAAAVQYLLLLGSFVSGAALSTLLMEAPGLRRRKSKYALPLLLEAVLLTALLLLGGVFYAPAAWHQNPLLPCLAALAMGMQNATITNISGNVVRTTHVTGVLTDLSIAAIQCVFGRASGATNLRSNPSAQRFVVLAAIFLSFTSGAALAAWVYPRFGILSFSGPICCLLALVIVDWRKPIAQLKPLDIGNDPIVRRHELDERDFPPQVAVIHLAHGSDAAHRAPDFDSVLDSIPAEKKVVILIFSPRMRFDANSILGLEKLAREFNTAGRTLLLAGVTNQHYASFKAAHLVEKIGREAIHADLEFALAHAAAMFEDTYKDKETDG